jgi:MoaA/NifB/PqqE/SkfB family radical SAM enzyme
MPVTPERLRIELTIAALQALDVDQLVRDGISSVVIARAGPPERVPASFRNGVAPRDDVPVLLDAVAPVSRFVAAARSRGIAVAVEGFPRGIFDGAVPDGPVTAMIEVSSRCNLQCPLCSVGRGALSRHGDMPKDVFARLVAELGGTVKRLALHNLGEPLLHPELPELVKLAKEAGIAEVFLSTNLAVDAPGRVRGLARSGIDEIVCSLDAADPATYPVYRVGGRFEVVLRNLEALTSERAKLARGPRIRLQFLLFKHNEHEVDAFRALARRFGVGYEIKVASAPLDQEERWLPADPALRRREREADHGWCTRPTFHTTILSDGRAVPCCKDADGKHALGDASRDGFAAVWSGPAYQGFRERIRTDKAGIPLCRRCPGGWFLGSNVVDRVEDPWGT